eukprot:scaffold427_cov263-Pinguiococcus_pyrenoidosus.AAC.10
MPRKELVMLHDDLPHRPHLRSDQTAERETRMWSSVTSKMLSGLSSRKVAHYKLPYLAAFLSPTSARATLGSK